MSEQPKFARRTLFAGLGVAAAAAVALKVTKPAAPVSEATAAAEPEGDGYRLTEHIKKYYRTTTI